MNIKLLQVTLACLLLLGGCATITSGSTQTISVSSSPAGASVTVTPGEQKTTTPGKLILKRDGGPYMVKVTLEGYAPYSVLLATETNGWVFGNLIVGGLIGLAIDSSTGAWIKLTPNEISTNLVKLDHVIQKSSNDRLFIFDSKGHFCNHFGE